MIKKHNVNLRARKTSHIHWCTRFKYVFTAWWWPVNRAETRSAFKDNENVVMLDGKTDIPVTTSLTRETRLLLLPSLRNVVLSWQLSSNVNINRNDEVASFGVNRIKGILTPALMSGISPTRQWVYSRYTAHRRPCGRHGPRTSWRSRYHHLRWGSNPDPRSPFTVMTNLRRLET